MKVNGKEIKGNKFAYDGCHKIYICEDKEDIKEAVELSYGIFDIRQIEEIYEDSCPLRFISNWKLDKNYIEQFSQAKFEE